MHSSTRFTLWLMLAPALLVVGLLFAGGLLLAFAQSLGWLAPAGAAEFTLKHYAALWTDRELRAALALTLALATLSTLLSAVLGVAVALTLRPLAARWSGWNFLLQVPLAVPHLVLAVVVINVLAPSGLLARLAFAAGLIHAPADFPALIHDRYGAGIVLTYVLKETPFVAVMTLALLARVGEDYEMLARTLGASAWQRLRYVTLPLVAPAALSAALVVFAFLFGAFEVPYLLGRPYPAMLAVVAQRRFQATDLAERPGALALALASTALTALLTWVYLRLARRLTGAQKPLLF